uniref:OmpA family protein n=1 Tax=Candidatus Kentrum sp. LPFa TaxID=2126335 RepID=A0A450W8G0_9GAMM|nr:MAG: OmpA family protein [Candidatus Kentron sp. LPFa]VFK31280.1 MAG: OmpA family protein [Candidatus Kentron sp. LPFa]
MNEEKSIAWIGFTDLFLYLFISILAIFIIVQFSFAKVVEDAKDKNLRAAMMEKELHACREQESKLEGKILALKEDIRQEREDSQRKEEGLRNISRDLRTCKEENSTIQKKYRAYQAKVEYRERIKNKHEKLIADALNVLKELKEDMSDHKLPIHIETEPDRIYFDMGVSFISREVSIPDGQKKSIIKIGKKFKEILDRVVMIGSKRYYLRDLMRVVVEGHADDQKVHEMANFDVSKDRAFRVIELLIRESGLEPPIYKINMAAFAEFGRQPKLTDEEQEKGIDYKRGRMRRVTISIVPSYTTLLAN